MVERDGAWSMVVGAGLDDGTGAVLHYRSDDLTAWVYDGVLARIGDPGVRTVAECPQLVEVAGRWAVIVSVQADDEPGPVVARFLDGADESWAPLATGAAAYATTAFRDRDGRRLRDLLAARGVRRDRRLGRRPVAARCARCRR